MTINVRHGKDVDVIGPQEALFTRIQAACADDDDSVFIEFRAPATDIGEMSITKTCQGGKDHTVDIARWRCFLGVEIPMSIDPDNTQWLVYPCNSANRAKSNAMIATQDKRELVCLQSSGDLGGQLFRCLNDWFEIFQ